MASAAAAKKWPRLSQCRVLASADQPQVRLVDQGRRLERLAGLLLASLCGRQPAQLVVDQRQELRRGTGVALLDGVQDAGHLIHRQYRSTGESQRKMQAEFLQGTSESFLSVHVSLG